MGARVPVQGKAQSGCRHCRSSTPIDHAAAAPARPACSRLAVLNASAVSSAERWDAEVNYLRLVTDELAAAAEHAAGGSAADAQAARAAVLAANPRFGALTQVYGPIGRLRQRVHLLLLQPAGAWEVACAVAYPHQRTPPLQKYGELTPAAPKAATGTALASGMALISVTHGGKVLQKKLPGVQGGRLGRRARRPEVAAATAVFGS